MESKTKARKREGVRARADEIKDYVCKNLVAVIEDPKIIRNIGSVIRNVEALGVEKTYIIDPGNSLPDDWHDMRQAKSLSKVSASAVKWSFVKRFDNTEDCIAHLQFHHFTSIVTSPHRKGARYEVLHEADYTQFKKLAVWFGNESRGVSDLAVKHSEFCVGIPMFGLIESLNLGTSSGIVLYEITRQRRAFQLELYNRRREKKDGLAAQDEAGE